MVIEVKREIILFVFKLQKIVYEKHRIRKNKIQKELPDGLLSQILYIALRPVLNFDRRMRKGYITNHPFSHTIYQNQFNLIVLILAT